MITKETVAPRHVSDVADALRPLTDSEVAQRRACGFAGTGGHYGCGVCEHGLAYIECLPCLHKRFEEAER